MLKRPTSGSVVCAQCGRLVGVRDKTCLGCGRSNPGLWGFAPLLSRFGRDLGFTQLVLGGCIFLYLATLLYAPDQIRSSGLLSLFSPGPKALFTFGASGAAPIFGYGRWWTVLSAAWLHGGILHIFFNMMWIRQLAPATAQVFGVGRLIIIYTVSSITGFLLTSFIGALTLGPLNFLPRVLHGAQVTLGASASLCGLFGALLLFGRRTGNRVVTQQIWQFVIMVLAFGLLIPGIDNWAHIGGFGGGYLVALWLDPMREEDPRHLLVGLVCLAAMALSIVVSIVHARQLEGLL